MKFIKNNIRDEILDLMCKRQNENVQQADYLRLIYESKEKEEKFKERALVLSANYFTREKIEEIANDSKKYLKKNDIDVEELEDTFSDSSKIDINIVERLIYRESQIQNWKTEFNSFSEPFSSEKALFKQKIIHMVNDINGGSSNEC